MKTPRVQSPWRRPPDIDKAVLKFAEDWGIESENAAVNVLLVMQLQLLKYKI